MLGIEWLKPAVFFGSILYALVGVAVFWISFVVVDKRSRPTTCGRRSSRRRTSRWRSWSARWRIAIGQIVAAAIHG